MRDGSAPRRAGGPQKVTDPAPTQGLGPSPGLGGPPGRLARLRAKYGVLGELLAFLWEEKLWWMIPLVVVFLLFAAVFLFAQSPAGPLIYTIF